MGDGIDIEPDEVKTSGGTMKTEASEARSALTALFDSAQPAASGNKGFTTGPKLTALATLLKGELNDTIDELETTGGNIVASAQGVSATDDDTAEGASRIATALNGLGKQPA